jgi:hypothetical protein
MTLGVDFTDTTHHHNREKGPYKSALSKIVSLVEPYNRQKEFPFFCIGGKSDN